MIGLSATYIRARALNVVLNVLLLGLGVGTIVVLLLFSRQFEERLEREARGIDLVDGAKGAAATHPVFVPPGIPDRQYPARGGTDLAADPMIKAVAPLALGDSYKGFRIVGTVSST